MAYFDSLEVGSQFVIFYSVLPQSKQYSLLYKVTKTKALFVMNFQEKVQLFYDVILFIQLKYHICKKISVTKMFSCFSVCLPVLKE